MCDPNALRTYGITLGDLYDAVAHSNSAVGGQTIQKNNAEYLVRGVGWIRSTKDIEDTVITQRAGTPVYVKNVAAVQIGPQFRRSVFEKDGDEAVGGAVMMRYGENPLAVTDRIKQKIQELQSGLPKGVHIVPAYDRTRLIHGAIDALTGVSWFNVSVPFTSYHVPLPWPEGVMWHEMIIAAVAIMLILMHFRSAFVICITLPLAVLFAFLMMWLLRSPAYPRCASQHHVAGRPYYFHRHSRGPSHRHGRERDASTQGPFRRQESDRRHSRNRHSRLQDRRPAHFLLRHDYFDLFYPCFRHERPRGKTVPSGGSHQELGDDRHGADSVTVVPALIPTFIPRQAAPRGGQLDRPQFYPRLQTVADVGAAKAQFRHVVLRRTADRSRWHVSRCKRSSVWAPRIMIGKSVFLRRPGFGDAAPPSSLRSGCVGRLLV